MNNKLPLVSVVVITYNSSKTVLETLESIKNQTYRNIELIISDDCSKDNTVEICRKWVYKNEDRFIQAQIITIDKNTGTAGNLNRGFQKSNGMWIKSIAGDDILMNKCIESNINYIQNNPRSEILLSKIEPFGDYNRLKKYNDLFNYGALYLTSKELLYLLLLKNFLPASTLFIKRQTFEELGGYEESIPLLEDWPFWIKVLYNKKSISFNNDFTVNYRMSDSSISLSNNTPSPLYQRSLEIFYSNYLREYRYKINKLLWFYFENNKWRANKPFLIKIISKFINYINPIRFYLTHLENKSKVYNNKIISENGKA